jgi:hypothetical protein
MTSSYSLFYQLVNGDWWETKTNTEKERLTIHVIQHQWNEKWRIILHHENPSRLIKNENFYHKILCEFISSREFPETFLGDSSFANFEKARQIIKKEMEDKERK